MAGLQSTHIGGVNAKKSQTLCEGHVLLSRILRLGRSMIFNKASLATRSSSTHRAQTRALGQHELAMAVNPR